MNEQVTQTLEAFTGQTEQELVAASRTGDTAAYAELWRRTHRLAYSVARARSSFDADDIVSAAYASVWEQLLKGGGPKEAFKAYLVQVTRNLSTRAFHASSRTTTDAEIEPAPVADTAETIVHSEERGEVLLAFRQLPENWQQALWWQEVEGIDRTEVARRMSLSANGVSALTRRAREGLRLSILQLQLPEDATLTHPRIVAHFPKLLRGSLPARAERELTGHLHSCAECSLLANELRTHNPNLVLQDPAADTARSYSLVS